MLLDRDLCLRMAEGPALDELGWSTGTVHGRPLEELVAGEPGRTLVAHCRAALEGEARSFEFPLDGRTHFVEAVPVIGFDEGISGVLAVSLDVTDRQQAEEDLRTSERDFRLLTENATDFVSRQDREARLVYASPSSRSLFGFTPDELAGRSGFDFVHPDDLEHVRQTYREVLRTPGGFRRSASACATRTEATCGPRRAVVASPTTQES